MLADLNPFAVACCDRAWTWDRTGWPDPLHRKEELFVYRNWEKYLCM